MPDSTDPATVALYDAQVGAAWIMQKLSDGTKLQLGHTNNEQMFAVTTSGTFAVAATQAGWYKCVDGSEARATIPNMKGIIPNAGGHTHPLGRNSDIIADMPGPEDGRMARATGKPAYVISRRRAFSIRETTPNAFDVKLIAGAQFSKSELARVAELQVAWSRHGGGTGVVCHFIPD